jgi:hypothetical protein
MARESLTWLNDEWEGIPDPPEPPDPHWSVRRLAAAVLLRAVMDSQFTDPHIRRDAMLFLSPRDDRFREHLQLTLRVSGVNQRWFRRRIEQRLQG